MAFCINCGQQLVDGAKFCANCGTAVKATDNAANCVDENADVEIGISVLLNNNNDQEFTEKDIYLEHNHKTLAVNIPNGISVGQRIRLRGMGKTTRSGKVGNLFIRIDHIDYKKSAEQQTTRKVIYDGEIHKCPNCGEVLKAFEINCPSCGHELRNIKVSSAVKEFALKLEAIESKREYEKPRGLFANAEAQQRISKTDEQKISLIKNFSVPNSREDMLEFMILATSNMNMKAYDSANTETTKVEKEISDAWFSKVRQVYEKAKRSYSTDDVFAEIKELYDQCNANVKNAKKKGVLKWILLFGWIPIFFIIVFSILGVTEPKAEKEEIERLENIIVEVQQSLDHKEYKHALRLADSIDYQRYDIAMERKWDIQREYWVERIIDLAATDGIILEHTFTPDIDKANDESKEDDEEHSDGFIEGILDGIESAWNSSQMTNSTEESSTKTDFDYSANTIKKGAVYTYGHDEGGLYCATAISDSIIKIERWGKHLTSQKSFNQEYEVGAFKITDAQYEFVWIDESKTAFSFALIDENDGDFKKSKNVTFTILGIDGNTNKGTNYNTNGDCYSYQHDDWHLYRAILLTNEIIKIECWYRPMAIGSFHYGYDIYVINQNDTDTDFEWTDDEHTSFTISIQDKNNSDLKNLTFVAFTQD